MTLEEMWLWMDAIGSLAFGSAEPLCDRAFYARWWAELAEEVSAEDEEPGDLILRIQAQTYDHYTMYGHKYVDQGDGLALCGLCNRR
jgi:hypothetical protein